MNWRRALTVALTVALWVVAVAFAVQTFPGLVGADHALAVQSGSMEPTIPAGAMVFVNAVPADAVEEGDVVTYIDDGRNFITHGVVEKDITEGSVSLVTRGDANEEPDGERVYPNQFVGSVMFTVPLIGYIVSFGHTRAGWVVLIAVPALLVIFSELWSLYGALEPEQS